MKYTMRVLLVLLLLISSSAIAQSSAAEVLSLEAAIDIGLRNNYDIQIARNSARVGQINRGRGTAGFLPTLDVNASYRLSNSDETSNSPFSFGSSDVLNYGATASLNWTLFDGFKMFVDKKRYDELAMLGTQQARDAIERTVVLISRAYLNVVQQQQLLEVARENRDISRDRLERERVRNELGGSTTDLLNAQVAFNSDQSALLTQELQVAT
jgi:outer membrane protein